MDTCELCLERTSKIMFAHPGGMHVTVCPGCYSIIAKQHLKLHRESEAWFNRRMRIWFKDQQAVKRFYKRQCNLQLEEE